MAEKYTLAIEDFWGKGRTFRTEVSSWSYEVINVIAIDGRDAETHARIDRNKVQIVRDQDKNSHHLSTLSVLNLKGMSKIFPQATLTVDYLSLTGSKQHRTIYDFFEVGVISFAVGGTAGTGDSLWESITIDYEKMTIFDISVELLP